MANALTKVSITPAADGYQLHVEDADGGSFDAIATFEQLDILSEEIDRNLDLDEEEELVVNDAK
jgi:hypothetical protein